MYFATLGAVSRVERLLCDGEQATEGLQQLLDVGVCLHTLKRKLDDNGLEEAVDPRRYTLGQIPACACITFNWINPKKSDF